MNKRQQAAAGCVFMHIPDSGKRNRIEALCRELGLAFRTMEAGDVNRTVLELVSGQTAPGIAAQSRPAAPALYFLPELLLFQGLTGRDLSRFLDAYREAGIPRTDLKAAVTPQNLRWTLYELAEQLKEEHRAMG